MVSSYKRIRALLRFLWAYTLAVSGCLWWAKRRLYNQHAIIVLMFHRVLDRAAFFHTRSQSAIVISAETFHQLLEYAVREFEPVVLENAQQGKAATKLRLAFTFDDGWSDNYGVAFPLLQKFNVPCTVFVCPELAGQKAPFWPERAAAFLRKSEPTVPSTEIDDMIERWKTMRPAERERRLAELAIRVGEFKMSDPSWDVDSTLSWQQIAEMHQGGVRFGSHTSTHQILTTVTAETAAQELRSSKTALELALRQPCETFAYPNGGWSEETRRLVAGEHFRLAVTTERGVWATGSDPLAIPRLSVCEENVVGPWGHFSATVFEYATVWKAWRATWSRKSLWRSTSAEVCQAGAAGKSR
jgi:peptidoglycan/xylan/chitin deacetylase (PgdA/CDA1 family)